MLFDWLVANQEVKIFLPGRGAIFVSEEMMQPSSFLAQINLGTFLLAIVVILLILDVTP